MKKLISILSSLAILSTCGVTAAVANAEETTETKNIVLGDVDENGVIDYKDVALCSYYYAYAIAYDGEFKDEYPEGEYSNLIALERKGMPKEKAESLDVDGDGKLSSADIVYLIKYIAACSAGYSKPLTPENLKGIGDIYNSDAFNKYASYVSDIYLNVSIKQKNENFLDFKMTDYNTVKVFDYSEVKMGDANADGTVDSKDAVTVLNSYAMSMAKNSSEEYDVKHFNSDFNCDGVVDSKDAVGILKSYAESLVNNR